MQDAHGEGAGANGGVQRFGLGDGADDVLALTVGEQIPSSDVQHHRSATARPPRNHSRSAAVRLWVKARLLLKETSDRSPVALISSIRRRSSTTLSVEPMARTNRLRSASASSRAAATRRGADRPAGARPERPSFADGLNRDFLDGQPVLDEAAVGGGHGFVLNALPGNV